MASIEVDCTAYLDVIFFTVSTMFYYLCVMGDFSKKKLRYQNDWEEHKGDGPPIALGAWAYKDITRSHTKRYHNCLYLLAGLNSCCRDLMDFMTEEMDSSNTISTNRYFIDRFISFIENTTSKDGEKVSYKESSVRKALTTLIQKGLARKVTRGCIRINPEYFWKNNDSKRLDFVKVELEFREKLDVKLKVWRKKNGVAENAPLKVITESQIQSGNK